MLGRNPQLFKTPCCVPSLSYVMVSMAVLIWVFHFHTFTTVSQSTSLDNIIPIMNVSNNSGQCMCTYYVVYCCYPLQQSVCVRQTLTVFQMDLVNYNYVIFLFLLYPQDYTNVFVIMVTMVTSVSRKRVHFLTYFSSLFP